MRYLTTKNHLYKEMDDFFESIFSDRQASYPKVNVSSNETAYIIETELPGFTKEDIRIRTEKDQLTIETTKKIQTDSENYLLQERTDQNYKRTFTLPSGTDNIQATMKNGILTITIEKNKQDLTKEIEIK